jgi:DNA-binding transcriptional regulator YdaS (Cro superfamily)
MNAIDTKMISPEKAVERAIQICGSEARLAWLVGYTQSAITHARNRGNISAELAVSIEAVTDGRVKRIWMRPDIFSEKATVLPSAWRRRVWKKRAIYSGDEKENGAGVQNSLSTAPLSISSNDG